MFDHLPSHEVIFNVRNKLRNLGYDARIANFCCYDIHINGWIHYLSFEEASNLIHCNLPHPVDLMLYSELQGLNRWYTFPQE